MPKVDYHGAMKIATFLVIAAFIFQQSGCEQAPKPTAPPEKVRHSPPIHRFENVSTPASPGVALDTVTGQYCKTWDWAYKASGLSGGLDTLPTCLSIHQSAPTTE